MAHLADIEKHIRGIPEPGAAPRAVLVVDDSRVQRKILSSALARWGYLVEEAGDGPSALSALSSGRFDFVLSDWVMPGMTGLDLCRAFRDLPRDSYGYFILLTAKTDRDEVLRGFEVGADDFLAKPVNLGELHARMQAGERILTMQRELTEKNRLVSATLAEMQRLYATLDRDLIEARKLQMTLVRERERDFGAARVSVLLRPSGHVGGDLVGYFPLSRRRVVFYAIDVAGHGVASAIMAARLAGMFTASEPEGPGNLLMSNRVATDPWPPEMVAARLNRTVLETMQVEQYFTCVYAEADLTTGQVALVQAGHPHPLVLRAGGAVERVGTGGLPVGLVPRASWDRVALRLFPGDRLVLMSDGLTEAADGSGRELGEAGLAAILRKNRALEGPSFLEALLWDVHARAGDGDLADDISAVLYEYRGSGGEGKGDGGEGNGDGRPGDEGRGKGSGPG